MIIATEHWISEALYYSGVVGWLIILMSLGLLIKFLRVLAHAPDRRSVWMMICLSCVPLALGIGGAALGLRGSWGEGYGSESAWIDEELWYANITAVEGVVATALLLIVGSVGLLLAWRRVPPHSLPEKENGAPDNNEEHGAHTALLLSFTMFLVLFLLVLRVYASDAPVAAAFEIRNAPPWWWRVITALRHSGNSGMLVGVSFAGALAVTMLLLAKAKSWRPFPTIAAMVMLVLISLHVTQENVWRYVVTATMRHVGPSGPAPSYWGVLATYAARLLIVLLLLDVAMFPIVLFGAPKGRRTVRIGLVVLLLMVLGLHLLNLGVLRHWHFSMACLRAGLDPPGFLGESPAPKEIGDLVRGIQALAAVWGFVGAPVLLVLCAIGTARARAEGEPATIPGDEADQHS